MWIQDSGISQSTSWIRHWKARFKVKYLIMSKIKLIKKAVNLSLGIAESLCGGRCQNSMLLSRGFTMQISKKQKKTPENNKKTPQIPKSSGFVPLASFHSVLIWVVLSEIPWTDIICRHSCWYVVLHCPICFLPCTNTCIMQGAKQWKIKARWPDSHLNYPGTDLSFLRNLQNSGVHQRSESGLSLFTL